MNPSVDGELVMAGPLDHLRHAGVEPQAHRRNEERGGDSSLVQQVHDPWERHASSVLAL